ncbi:MAG: zinc-binding dehydrogenase [Bacteroidales bacterium]|nr:zinc-binding dehydrogenase [Bacteroidales bacterium]
MKAIYLIKNGKAEIAFEKREIELKESGKDEIAIEAEAFGLNFADVLARLGLYKECPPLPAIIGYEAVGKVVKIGAQVKNIALGDRVIAFTRFGGYSQYIITKAVAAVKIDNDFPLGKALALATQYTTAYYAAFLAANIREGEKVLIHAAAGGVGTALIQLCKLKNCKIYGTAGSDEKIEYIKNQGVDFPINYRQKDFSTEISEKLDVVFDSIGGSTFKKGYKLLGSGGRIIPYGAATQLDAGNFFSKLKFALSFGIYHPVGFIMQSKAMIGVNMLRIADDKPEVLQYCMQNLVKLAQENKINPKVFKMYSIDELNEAHTALENRETIGKVGIKW